jgi:ubiquinone/menaquinone biosynthesis C-methylase UbiE
MQNGETFWDFAAYAGFTKHMGGLEATKELAALCHIGEGTYVLDVGCGAGATPCFLAKGYRCKVVGVDISAGMIERSNETARREGVAHSVEFRVADAQDLPFENDLFDAVITESVTAFPEDKQLAVKEYARVTKPGGYVGLNESTWLKVPPPPEIEAWLSQDLGGNAQPLTTEEWVELMENAGLQEISVRMHAVDIRDETRAILQRYGCVGMLRVWSRMFVLYVRNPAYRRFVKGLREGRFIPDNLNEYFGYGLYIGQVP